jgi:hypothetical protein
MFSVTLGEKGKGRTNLHCVESFSTKVRGRKFFGDRQLVGPHFDYPESEGE